ncbi:hypothetical protein [Bifidobacterium myosotis]|uniref:Uncharacterized protein n=1 Tax=Bifidobacterium myosotis TaxID=1630166 RepID=A0A5M9ZH46_9BIFI|nr:hypothetical protein [Bifidobacterium myosotis]KAA8826941.1 hypothetical protein EMO91_10445 [Bifidobacterium myosotis]
MGHRIDGWIGLLRLVLDPDSDDGGGRIPAADVFTALSVMERLASSPGPYGPYEPARYGNPDERRASVRNAALGLLAKTDSNGYVLPSKVGLSEVDRAFLGDLASMESASSLERRTESRRVVIDELCRRCDDLVVYDDEGEAGDFVGIIKTRSGILWGHLHAESGGMGACPIERDIANLILAIRLADSSIGGGGDSSSLAALVAFLTESGF